jgi:multisubunit Na+/H+ antiporter MnhC subunit
MRNRIVYIVAAVLIVLGTYMLFDQKYYTCLGMTINESSITFFWCNLEELEPKHDFLEL